MAASLSLSTKLLLALAGLFGLFYLAMGILWLVAPVVAAGALGASLLQGTGFATQLGDSASFFICSGLFMLLGVLRRNASFLFAGGLLIGLVAPVRLLAWQVYHAPLTLEPIVAEVVTLLVLFAAARAVRSSRAPAAGS